jgi:hypothetical protein
MVAVRVKNQLEISIVVHLGRFEYFFLKECTKTVWVECKGGEKRFPTLADIGFLFEKFISQIIFQHLFPLFIHIWYLLSL